MQGDDHIASTLKRCCSNARVILKIVNILMVLKTAHSTIRGISIIPSFKLLMQLGFIRNGKIIQIKEIAEIPVMPDGLCTLPPPPPHTHTHCPFGHNTMGYLYYNLFLGSALYLPTLRKRQVGQGNRGSPSESFCVNATAVN